MKKGGGKRKGSAFERKVAGLLDKWWEVPKNTFWRTVNSGGWQQPGDIAPRIGTADSTGKEIWWPFVVECKHYKSINLWEVIKQNKNGLIMKWWKQVTTDQHKFKEKIPIRLLIFRENNLPVCVIFSENDLFKLKSTVLPFSIGLRFQLYNFGFQELVIVPWDVFSTHFTKNYFERLFHDS